VTCGFGVRILSGLRRTTRLPSVDRPSGCRPPASAFSRPQASEQGLNTGRLLAACRVYRQRTTAATATTSAMRTSTGTMSVAMISFVVVIGVLQPEVVGR
jgi:hypothetical protein